MPKKLKPESQAVQSKRFKRDAQKLIDAGELSPTADDVLDALVRAGTKPAKTAGS